MLDVFRHAIEFEFWYGRETLDEWMGNLELLLDAVRRLALSERDPRSPRIPVLSFAYRELGDAVLRLRNRDQSVRKLLGDARDSVDLVFYAVEELSEDQEGAFSSLSQQNPKSRLEGKFAALKAAIAAPGSDSADHQRCIASRALYLFLVYCLCVSPADVSKRDLDEFCKLHADLIEVMRSGTAYYYSCLRRGSYSFGDRWPCPKAA